MLPDIVKYGVVYLSSRPVNHTETGTVPAGEGPLGDQFIGE